MSSGAPFESLIDELTNSIAKPKSESDSKKATETAEKGKRRKKDVNAPKKPVCAFFWYQRDPKNAITDPAITTHKDKIRVSGTFFDLAGLAVLRGLLDKMLRFISCDLNQFAHLFDSRQNCFF